jgi:hypothetical protein
MSRDPASRSEADVTVTDRPSTVTYVVVSWYPSERDCRTDSSTHRTPGPSVRGTVFMDHSSAEADPPSARKARTTVRTMYRDPRELLPIDIRSSPFD